MLERTAGCLESRTLKRLLPSSNSLKSRRALHSTFWNHSAGPLELSPLWAVLVTGSGGSHRRNESQIGQQTSTPGAGLILDFLYPTGTANLLRKYTSWAVEPREGLRKRVEWRALGQRLYSSSAQDPLIAEPPVEENCEAVDVDSSKSDVDLLTEMMARKGAHDYELCWRLFTTLDKDAQQQLRHALIEHLSTSDRTIDAERALKLFSVSSSSAMSAETYGAAIQASLTLQDSDSALRIHDIAVENSVRPVSSDHLFAYLIGHRKWNDATRIWTAIQKFRNKFDHKSFAILDQLPDFGSRALCYAWHIDSSTHEKLSEDKNADPIAMGLAIALVKRALFYDTSLGEHICMKLLAKLESWNLATSGVYNVVLRVLMATDRTKIATKVYRKIYPTRRVRVDRANLSKLLRITCYNSDVLGMRAIMADYFHFHKKPPVSAYRMCMIEFASQGDAVTVHALFNQLQQRYKGEYVVSAADLQPILHVHAVRGEIDDVIKNFHELESVYGVRPNLICWNIMLNAYGKVNDVDSAMDCFETILASPDIQPDDYTFGTIMGICVTRGDAELATQVYRLSEKLNIQKGAAMVDCLVLAHVQNGLLKNAEDICEAALHVKLLGTLTRMWNTLLVAYALRRDLKNVNRIVRRMIEAKVPSNAHTYSALMLSLSMIKQPDRAFDILTKVMPEAGIRPNQLHYAVAMRAFLQAGKTARVFQLRRHMVRSGLQDTARTNLFAMKAAAIQGRKAYSRGKTEEPLARAMEIFQGVIETVQLDDISNTGRKDTNRLPRPVARASMLYTYLLFILGQSNKFETVKELYAKYTSLLKQHQQDVPPLEVLSALMNTYLRQEDHEAVAQCWELSVARAKEQGKSLTPSVSLNVDAESSSQFDLSVPEKPKIVSLYQLELNSALTFYMNSLSEQSRVDELPGVVNALQEDGFVIDNNNWNVYVQHLAQKYRWKVAFDTCEKILMPNWTGWAQVRWELPVRNRLPLEIRYLKNQPRHYRAKYHTLLYLAKAYLELRAAAAESQETAILMAELVRRCPMTIGAIRTMRRTGDEFEKQVLGGS